MASYEFGAPITKMATLQDLKSEIINLQEGLDYFSQNLNHHNVKTLFTEYCDIKSEHGETVIDGPLVLMYSATDSTTLRLRMGFNSSEFVFELYDLAGNEVISLDSSGDAVFSGTMRTSEEAFIGRNIYIANSSDSPSTDVYRGLWINAGTTYQVALVNDSTGGAARLNAYGWLLEYANHVVIRSSAPPPMDGQIQMDSTYGSIYIFASSLIELRGHDQAWINSTAGSVWLTASSWVVNNAKALLYCASGGDITFDATGGNVILLSTGNYIGGIASSNQMQIGSPWTSWTPSLTWTGGTPANVLTVARYKVIGKTCFVTFRVSSADGNAATNLTISLPIATASIANHYVPIMASMAVNNVWSNPLGGIDLGNGLNIIVFKNFATCTDNVSCYIFVEGFYEIA